MPPFEVNNVLYVRETWYKGLNRILYRANYSENEKFYTNGKETIVKWKPSIHMPKSLKKDGLYIGIEKKASTGILI